MAFMQEYKEKGFSIVEMIIVLAVIMVIAAVSVIGFATRDQYNADDQAYKVFDMMKEARQRAMSQRETMRVEINKDESQASLINENDRDDQSDDVIIRTIQFAGTRPIVYDRAPDNIDNLPTAVTPIPSLEFKSSLHPSSLLDNVGTLRFLSNGSVVDAGSNWKGANASVTGATIYFWSPARDEDGNPTESGTIIRAITVLGSSGNTEYMSCPVVGSSCAEWE